MRTCLYRKHGPDAEVTMKDKRVLVIGGGVAGLSAAIDIADFGIAVDVIDRADFIGGHAIQFACKATDACVRCGACIAEEKLRTALAAPGITLRTGTRIDAVDRQEKFSASIVSKPAYIDPEKCTDCGLCLEKCPAPGAILSGASGGHHPFFALQETACLYMKDRSCGICRDICPEGAVTLEKIGGSSRIEADAIVVATGFDTFDPSDKPYGYGQFPDVVTTLELERVLKREGRALRPSDGARPRRIAFIQCVGSRDARLGHLWCSKICCGSALRMARLIRDRQPETEITLFYIDIQTFGRDFPSVYKKIETEIDLVRAIPGDIFANTDGSLRITFADEKTRKSAEAEFDLVVLSVGMIPCADAGRLADQLRIDPADTGFFRSGPLAERGVFVAGSARGPMSISETVASAGNAAWQVLRYLESGS
jgi:heterodisulfide reductase subunit A2